MMITLAQCHVSARTGDGTLRYHVNMSDYASSGEASDDFSAWTRERLAAHLKHLESLLLASVGQSDPERPQLRAEHEAARAALQSKET